jgi:hypothetical protein
MEGEFTDLLNHTEMTEIVNQVDPKQLEYERALEIVTQNILGLINQCFSVFPLIKQEIIKKSIEEINTFLSFHQTYEEKELVDYIGTGLQVVVQDYPWKERIKQ